MSEFAAAGLLGRWYFIRYGLPTPQLRLRLHAPQPTGGPTLLAARRRLGC